MTTNNDFRRRRRLIIGMTMAMVAAVPGYSDILFRPVGRPPEVFAYNGTTMSKPLTNTNALNNPKVYVIFIGPNWESDGAPTAATLSMVSAVKAMLNSPYLSGLTQYGSDGRATYGAYTIDTTVDPAAHPANYMYLETDKILSEPAFSSWLPPPGGDARKSPIYVVARYGSNGTSVGGPYGGSNDYGPNTYTKRAINAIDVAITSADQVDEFSWVLSHELVERISTGTGSLIGVGSSSGNQICDGEPEGGDFYAWRLPGSDGPLVTSYWSFIDQAYIIPDGTLDRVLFVPMWNKNGWTGNFVSLQQGNLFLITSYPPAGPPQFESTTTKIDSSVRSFVINVSGGTAQIFDLTSAGEIKQYSGSGAVWTRVTDSSTVASELVSTSYLNESEINVYNLADGQVFMLSNKKAWQYSGSGTTWNLMIANVTATAVAASNGDLYENASPGGIIQTQFVNGYITGGGTVTSSTTTVQQIATADGTLYMLALNPAAAPLPAVWRFNSAKTSWTLVTDSATFVYRIVAAGDVLCMLATGPGVSGAIGVAQYSLTSHDWIPLTGSNTAVSQILVQDGNQLYMVAANGNGPKQVWQYSTPGNWTALTGLNTSVKSASIAKDNTLHMVAANNGGPIDNWIYDGTPGNWSIVN
jgi:hypothetical protein